MERKTHTKPADQRGMASIVITMVTMVVISLIVVGFATVSRREQRQSLDQLLSSQAFYAAESGVEDARAIIKSAVAAGQPIAAKDDCATNNPGGTYPTGDQTIVDSQYETSYTCLKVDPGPTSVLFDGVGQNSVVVPVTTDQPLTSLRVTWKPSTAPSGSPNVCPVSSVRSFSSQTNWTCGYGVLKADIVPTDGAITRAGLGAGLANGIFVPVRGGGAGQLSYAAARGGANVTDANCDTAGYTQCTATFTNIPGGVRSLSLRVTSMYRASDIQIEGFVGGNAQEIKGVQAIVDSTGRASDILRRIQVRLPLIQTGGKLPGYAISSNGAICKRFNVTPNFFAIPGDIVDPDTDNDMCNARTSGDPSATASTACTPRNVAGGVQTCRYYYGVTTTNRVRAPGKTVTSCIHRLVDGTTYNNIACNDGERFNHLYRRLTPELPWPQSCNAVSTETRTTVFFSDGTQIGDVASTPYPFCFDDSGNRIR